MRRVKRIEVCDMFWKSLASMRKDPGYQDIRKALAITVLNIAQGKPVNETRFANPAMAGILHFSLPHNTRVFHTYKEDTLVLAMISDHSSYGFHGKHRSKESETADKIWRAIEKSTASSPQWDSVKWQDPNDIVVHPELDELSQKGLSRVLEEISKESENFNKLLQKANCKFLDDVPEMMASKWFDDLVAAQDRVLSLIEHNARATRDFLLPEDFLPWSLTENSRASISRLR